MPFYEYQCDNCGHTLEAMQKINDEPLKQCPECGKPQLTRLMSAPVFRLKGAGWYETDFKGDQDHKKNLADRPESEASKDDVKPAAEATSDAGGKDAAGPKDSGTALSADKAGGAADKRDAKAPAAPSPQGAGAGGGMSKRGASATAAPTKTPAKPAAPKPGAASKPSPSASKPASRAPAPKPAPKAAAKKPAPKSTRRG